jgi:hypothetical protein
MKKYILAFIFGTTLALFGFPINTHQYWILSSLFVINGVLND